MKQKLQQHFTNKSNILLWVMIASFFLPWISYGFISQSGFDIPGFVKALNATAAYASKGRMDLGDKVYFSYAVYLFPSLILVTLFILKHRFVRLFVAGLPVALFLIAYAILKTSLFHYMGIGIYTFIIASMGLIFVEFTSRESDLLS